MILFDWAICCKLYVGQFMHNAVFPVEGQVMIDRTFSERKRENSLIPFCLYNARSTSTVTWLGSASELSITEEHMQARE